MSGNALTGKFWNLYPLRLLLVEVSTEKHCLSEFLEVGGDVAKAVQCTVTSEDIETTCRKARKILGLIYRRFCEHAEPSALLQLYMSLVRPHLEYGCHIWDPHLQKDKVMLENVQKFGLRICARQWDLGYNELLSNFHALTLQDRRLYHKLCNMYKICK